MNTEPLTITIDDQQITASMDAWRGVQRQITERLLADQETEEQAMREAGHVWHALYWVYGKRRAEECFSLEEAEHFLEGGEDYGNLSGYGIRLPDGSLRMREWKTLDPKFDKVVPA